MIEFSFLKPRTPKEGQPTPGPDHLFYARAKKSPAILKILICSTIHLIKTKLKPNEKLSSAMLSDENGTCQDEFRKVSKFNVKMRHNNLYLDTILSVGLSIH